jgi:hypothetical protein
MASTYVQVTVAGVLGDCPADLGYRVHSYGDKKQRGSQGKDELTKKFPQAKSFFTKDNEKGSKHLGHHLVVVSSDVPLRSCKRHMFGIGFGKTKEEAQKDALKNLGKRSVWFEEDRDGFKVEESRAF